MKLFQMRKPRGFRHKYIYVHEKKGMHFRRDSKLSKGSQNTITLLVLLILLFAFWCYLN